MWGKPSLVVSGVLQYCKLPQTLRPTLWHSDTSLHSLAVVGPSSKTLVVSGSCLRLWHGSFQSSLTTGSYTVTVVGPAPKLEQLAQAFSMVTALFFTYFTLAI